MVCEFYLNKTVTYETKHTEDYMLPNIFGALFSTEQHICAVFLGGTFHSSRNQSPVDTYCQISL